MDFTRVASPKRSSSVRLLSSAAKPAPTFRDAVIQSKGGVMELSDLASHTSTPVTPISYNYHASNSSGIKLHEIPPNGQGLTALMALGILEHLEDSGVVPDLSTVPHNGTQWLHTLIECLRIAFADTRAFVADPEKTKVPTEELLAPSYLQSRAKLFHPKKANAEIKKGAPWKSSDTVYFSVADKEGNACSFIFSNYAGVGTGAVPKGCGFSLQNRGSNFVLEEGHPNCLEVRSFALAGQSVDADSESSRTNVRTTPSFRRW